MKLAPVALVVAFPALLHGQPSSVCSLDAGDTLRSAAGSLQSRVLILVSGRNAEPLEGADVVIETLDPRSNAIVQFRAGSTNARGEISAPLPASQPYLLRVRGIGYERACQKRIQPDKGSDTVRIALVFAARSLGGRPAPAIAPPDTIPTHSEEFDPVARAAGFKPLKQSRLDEGDRELRLWYGGWGQPEYLLRIYTRGTRVRGQLFLWWNRYESYDEGYEARTGKLVEKNYSCGAVRRALSGPPNNRTRTFVCEARFKRPPNWEKALRDLEENRVWTLPDPSALPSDGTITADGWGITGEVKTGGRYRTYTYVNPSTSVSPIPGYAIKIGDIVMAIVDSAMLHPKPPPSAKLVVSVIGTHEPLSGARVDFSPDSMFALSTRSQFTDARGATTFDSVPFGRAFLRTRRIGYQPQRITVKVSKREQRVSVEMKPTDIMAMREEAAREYEKKLALARSRPRHWDCAVSLDEVRAAAKAAVKLLRGTEPYLGIPADSASFVQNFSPLGESECARLGKAVDRSYGLIEDKLTAFRIGKAYWFPHVGYGILTDGAGKILVAYVVPD